MTEEEYLDPKKFPQTTQPGLTLQQQMFIDAFNLDALQEAIDAGLKLNQKKMEIWAELQAKQQFKMPSRE